MYNEIDILKNELNSILPSISCAKPDLTKLTFCNLYIKDKNYEFKYENIIDLLTKLISDFDRRFTDFTNINKLIKLFDNPFIVEDKNVPLQFREEVKALVENSQFISAFNSSKLLEFYKSLPNEFHELKQNAIKMTSFFPTTYRCERLFSHLSHIKNKKTNRISSRTLESRLRLYSTNFKPNINEIMTNRQYQKSH